MARLWIKYIAGFIDGEGSIGIHRRTREKGTIDWVPYKKAKQERLYDKFLLLKERMVV